MKFSRLRVIVLVIILVFMVGVIFYKKNKNKENVWQEVSKLMVLPSETPRIGEVTDKTKLIGQKFFEQSEDGDKVLIFDKALKAVLYRPSLNKIIEVTELTGENQPTPTVVELKQSETINPRVVIYNGTNKIGLASVVESAVIESKVEVNVVAKKMAVARNYPNTLMVELTGKTKNQTELLTAFGAKLVDKVPDGETIPSADVLIILGGDWLK
ncbi:hypothetical protein KBC75_03920 [Candidatus Shapirobacteria bacterium]|nr:hypothetical protein [Candidatus Shapirobacteria bacterium]